MLNLLGGGFLYPVLTGNLTTEWDLHNLLRETNGGFLAKRGPTVTVALGHASHLALVQLLLEVLHRVNSHHVGCQVIRGSDKQTTVSLLSKVFISCSVWGRGARLCGQP